MLDEKFMTLAIVEAKKGKELGNLAFGAVVVLNEKVISSAYAENISNKNATSHAELLAVEKACKNLETIDLKNCSIYTTHEPCIMCIGAILESGISRIIIGAVRGDFENRFKPKKFNIDNLIENYNYKPEIIKGILKEKVIELN